MRICRVIAMSVALIWFAGNVEPLQAAGRVQLVLVGDARGSAQAFQQWGQALDKAGVENVRIRSAHSGDEVGIDVRGTKENPLYVVTGIVKSSDELLLPAGRFKRRDAARLARWLEELAKYGVEGGRVARSAFGLSREQFEQLHKELARPIGFSTRGL
ncbi:MAG: hypothetical protein ACYSWU_15545, partial [Planctomycetota bacterium]